MTDKPQTKQEKPEKAYDREAKLKELLEEDQGKSSFADPFMGF